jgi:dimethylhistidine N-methyltransferase
MFHLTIRRETATREPRQVTMLEDVLEGLGQARKRLSASLLYDDEGIALFDRITRLPEYYPTRCELQLLESFGQSIADQLGEGRVLIEFGPASFAKAGVLLGAMHHPAGYLALDINAEAARGSVEAAAHAFPQLLSAWAHWDLRQRPWQVRLPAPIAPQPRTGFFPGSTIGNLDMAEAISFLTLARDFLGSDGQLLVGFDLEKDLDLLLPAYDDAQGVTARFNLNLLTRLNRELGGDFDLQAFAHRVRWNAAEAAVEMHIESLRSQTVHVAGRPFQFARGETIHTESSRKYTPSRIRALAEASGWRVEASWTDARGWFMEVLLG